MQFSRGIAGRVLALGLASVVPLSSSLAAEQHIVPPSELQDMANAAAKARQENLARIDQFFTLKPVQNALRASKIDSRVLRHAVAALNDDELHRLAARAEKAQADLAAGALSNQELTYIVIALATAVLILVIVAAR